MIAVVVMIVSSIMVATAVSVRVRVLLEPSSRSVSSWAGVRLGVSGVEGFGVGGLQRSGLPRKVQDSAAGRIV